MTSAHTWLLINKVRYYRVSGIVGSDQVEDGGIPVGMYASYAPQFAPSSILLRMSLFNSEVSSKELNRITYLHLSPPVSCRPYKSLNNDGMSAETGTKLRAGENRWRVEICIHDVGRE